MLAIAILDEEGDGLIIWANLCHFEEQFRRLYCQEQTLDIRLIRDP